SAGPRATRTRRSPTRSTTCASGASSGLAREPSRTGSGPPMVAPMKPLLIVNPRSGGGRTGSAFESMRPVVERALGEVDVAMTERPRHAVDLAREAAQAGRETVVAVGGDGSIHEIVNGLMQARELGANWTRLGILGQGTGG